MTLQGRRLNCESPSEKFLYFLLCLMNVGSKVLLSLQQTLQLKKMFQQTRCAIIEQSRVLIRNPSLSLLRTMLE
jgi:hypothetical protein